MATSSATIGILAGMGPYSTGVFIDLVVRECERQYGAAHDVDYPKMMILSLPAPFYPDRPIDHAAMEHTLRTGILDLVRAGSDFIAIACNTAHIYYAQLVRCTPVRILNMVELGTSAIPIHVKNVALIASRATTEAGIYQQCIRERGMMPLELTWQKDVDRLIGSVRLSSAQRAIKWRHIADQATAAGADVLLIACADLTTIRGDLDTALPIIDATQRLASGVVSEWLHLSR